MRNPLCLRRLPEPQVQTLYTNSPTKQFQIKLTITHSIFVRSRQTIRQIHRLEKADQMVNFLGHKNNFKMT
jgi:hypothetical protein